MGSLIIDFSDLISKSADMVAEIIDFLGQGDEVVGELTELIVEGHFALAENVSGGGAGNDGTAKSSTYRGRSRQPG